MRIHMWVFLNGIALCFVCVCEEEQFSQCFHSFWCGFLCFHFAQRKLENPHAMWVCFDGWRWPVTRYYRGNPFRFILVELNTQQKHTRTHKTVRHSVNTFVINFVWIVAHFIGRKEKQRTTTFFSQNNHKSGVILRSFSNVQLDWCRGSDAILLAPHPFHWNTAIF